MTKPDGSENDCTTFDVLFQPLESLLAQHECDHPSHHRETLRFKWFVRLLVYHFTKGCESGRQLLTDTLSAAPELGLPKVKRAAPTPAYATHPGNASGHGMMMVMACAKCTATRWKVFGQACATSYEPFVE
jgi:hypothetical protein